MSYTRVCGVCVCVFYFASFIIYYYIYLFYYLSVFSLYFMPCIQCFVTLYILFFSILIFISIHYFLLPGFSWNWSLPFMCYFITVLFFAFCQHIYHCPSSFIFLVTVYSSAVGCTESLGMKSRLISDNQLSASSAFRTWGIDAFTWLPHYARLDKQGKTNAWSPASNNRTEWLQVTSATFKPLSSH